jgi:hypothetical protein
MKSKLFLIAICTFFLTTSISYGYQATFTPRISVGEEYTDNVFLTDTSKEDDFITTISPSFTAEIMGKTSGAEISYDPSYAMYNTYDDNNHWRHLARFKGWSNITKNTSLNVRDRYLYTEDPIRDPDIALIRTEDPEIPVDSTIRRSLRIYDTNFASIALNHRFGEEDSFRLGYVNRFRNDKDPRYDDSRGNIPSIGVTYWFLPQWGFGADASYTKAEVENQPDRDILSGNVNLIRMFTKRFKGYIRYAHTNVDYKEGDLEAKDDQTYNPSVGFNYLIDKDISCLFNIGYFYNDFDLRDDVSGTTVDLRLIKTLERGSLNLSALGGYDYDLFDSENLNFNQFYEVGGSARYQLYRHISGNIFASYRNNDYKDFDREDNITRAGVGLSMQALPWMSLGLNYTYRNVDSTIETENYDVNRVFFRITLSSPRPYRTSKY